MMTQVSIFIIRTLILGLEVFSWIIIADVILSYFRSLSPSLSRIFSRITEPLYDFARSYIPTRVGMIDFSPVVIMIVIDIVRSLVMVLFSPYL